uniref:putative uncharacterized protein DDB_G0271982 isoform X3 n=1 Tax=Myxine glutinosa TaxID=7769 RepID=UPI00358FFB31
MNIVKVENDAGEPRTPPLRHTDTLKKMKVEVDDAEDGDTRDEEPSKHGSTFASDLIDAPQVAGTSYSALNQELPSSTSSSRKPARDFTRFRANRKRKLGVCVEFTKTLREMQRKQLEWDTSQRRLDREASRRRDKERREEKRWREEEERRREDEERRLDEERRRDEEERRRDRESFYALNAQLISAINNVATALIAKRRPK